MLISDTRGKVETILVQDDASTGVVLILQFHYHKGICDKGGGLAKDKIWKDHSRIFRYKISTILISSCTKQFENATAYKKNGTICLSEFNSMDFLAICELGFVLNAKKRNFLEEADPFIVPAEKLTFERNVHGSFGLPDTSHSLEGGILTGRRMMTMSDHGILYHLSCKYDEHRKLDVAFTSAMHMPKLDDRSGVLGLLLLTLWRTNLIWEASTTLLSTVKAIFAIPPWIVDEALRFILISIGKTNWIVGNTVLCKTWGLPIKRADSSQPIWPLILIHKFPKNTTSMVVNFVITAVIGALFAEKERKQIHRVGVRVNFLCRCLVHVSSVIMHLDSRCGNEHNALRFFLDPDLCEVTKPNISWNSLLAGYFESRGTSQAVQVGIEMYGVVVCIVALGILMHAGNFDCMVNIIAQLWTRCNVELMFSAVSFWWKQTYGFISSVHMLLLVYKGKTYQSSYYLWKHIAAGN
ncbi:hypothetical protein C1H46_023104 [Malus baccata]|uniref:Uncharacterized protein n=1 Tax=Malus baccata TaxID=106549 RepID=A0A540LYE9_MALBA|nr:hypothetical protein C1H46_023104 [Malus baccata]